MTPRVFEKIDELRSHLDSVRRAGNVTGLVPTMGALHAGHAGLIEAARQECDVVIVSVFVNPLQFGPTEDYARYPRSLESDLKICAAKGADLVFVPDVAGMYPDEQLTTVDVARVREGLCGAFRPGHFRGVATLVLKLFNIVQPHRAYFGQKDMQQLAVIRRMVRDLALPVRIVGVPTVRESDGLALSSRNQYLDPGQRQQAPALHRALQAIQQAVLSGVKDSQAALAAGREVLSETPAIRVEYLEIVDPDDMQPVTAITGPVRAAIAAWAGTTRLIDNVLCEPPAGV